MSIHRPASSHVRGGTRAAAQQEKVGLSTAGDRTRLVQHFGPDAEDVEHMSERYVDEQLPGAVQVPRCEDPRPRLDAPNPTPLLLTPDAYGADMSSLCCGLRISYLGISSCHHDLLHSCKHKYPLQRGVFLEALILCQLQ